MRRKAALYHDISLRLLNSDVMVGIAVAMMVESRATRNVQLQRDTKIRTSFKPFGYCLLVSSLEVSFFFLESAADL